MKKSLKLFLGLFVLASTVLFVLNTNAQNSQVSLDITGGSNTYNVSGSIYLSSRNASFTAYDKDVDGVNATFAANSFVAEDLAGDQAWTLSIKTADLVAGTHSISSGNVFIKMDTVVEKSGDTTCDATSDLTSSWVALNSDRVWLQKTADGKVCKAAVEPTIGVDIPANQAVGSYSATMTITAGGAGAPTYSATLTY